jgi:hypothetical protein
MLQSPPTPGGIMPEVVTILADAARLGIVLRPADDKSGTLQFRPRSAMTPELAERINASKPALLDALRDNALHTRGAHSKAAADTNSPSPDEIGPHNTESRVVSVVSVSEQTAPQSPEHRLWSGNELALLARAAPGLTPTDFPLVSAVKDAFADLPGGGATVTSIESAYGRGGRMRCRAAQLLLKARQSDTRLALAMRDAWAERMAVCTVEGGLPEDHAEQVALSELENILHY